jgi:hypothetical protein
LEAKLKEVRVLSLSFSLSLSLSVTLSLPLPSGWLRVVHLLAASLVVSCLGRVCVHVVH